ncbi:MAG: transcription termination factor NusA [Oscillospiraceae bacterium]|nr:transcription termination factor NusA [Oscillospiraceae bacterium]
MNKEFFEALECLAAECKIPLDSLVEKIEQGILKAVRREYPDCDEFTVKIDPAEERFDVCILRNVVDDEPIDLNEINIDEARTIVPDCVCGDAVPYKLDPGKFGRVAAQYAKQSIRHDVKEFEKEKLIAQYQDKVHDIVTATVQKVEPATGHASVLIEKNEIYLYKSEQIPGEVLKEGDIVKIYVVGIMNPDKKPSVKISRTHKDLVKRLFELEVPEIYDGIVEIKAIAREAGSRTKMAVCSKDENVDCIGACIGPKRSRISKVVEELKGEKIDIITYEEDQAAFIAKALAPADVIKVEIAEGEEKMCTVTVPNNQLSLAIGNKGQNAKLAARLTGFKIDIKPENPVD